MNRVVLVGRITRDPELRNSASGKAFTSFSIAVNRVMPNAQGERVADFINCVAFGKQAENLSRFIRKGGLIGVDGRLQTSSYQAQDGTNRTRTDVVCDSITFLEPKSASNNSYSSSYNSNNYSGSSYNNNNNYGSNYSQQHEQVNQDNSYVQTPQPQQDTPKYDENVEKQFEISDDDLPF